MKKFHFSNLVVYTDGSKTPEGAGAGVIVLDATGQLVYLENRILPEMTNNEAEYAALALGLEIAARLGADTVEIRADSDVMVNQMTGSFAIKSHRLKEAHWKACKLARSFLRVHYTAIPRDANALADVLAAEASAGRTWTMGGD